MKNTLFKLFYSLLIFGAIIIVFQSCYPGTTLTPEQSDLVATFFEKDADFSTLKTYSMPDSVIHVSDSTLASGNVNRSFDQTILNRIEQNLQSLGFTESSDPANADVHVVALATTSTWVTGGCYGGYWSYWYPYYGWCYPVAYTYTTGTVVVVMAQPDRPGDSKSVWIAGINGLLSDTNSGTVNRINNDIDQAFDQSPYLGNGK